MDDLSKAARFFGPRVGKSKHISLSTSSADTDLTSLGTAFANVAGQYIAFTADQDFQVAFDDSAVTIGTDHPLLKAGQLYSFIPGGKHMGLKGASAGTFYNWIAE